ncbi:hypothetical protein V1506DRAFT_544914 [Lipomyces tetrasporus]
MTADEERKLSKRKRVTELEEIEIDVNLPEPLSKKAQRKRKKSSSSTSQEDSANTSKAPATTESDTKDSTGSKDAQNKAQPHDRRQQSEYGIWIGNLPFNLNKDDLRRLFVSKSVTSNDDSQGGIKSEEIVRVHMPKKPGGQNKGFAYVDFSTEMAMLKAIALSETPFEGRKVLIKDARVFDGVHSTGKTKQAKQPTKILFVGNLPFETKESDLQEKFAVPIKSRLSNDDDEESEKITEIIKPYRVRMATFQDSGNCKGFAFIDYTSSDNAEKVLSILGSSIRILGRKGVKVEFGEDRSFRWKDKQEQDAQADEVGEGESARMVTKVSSLSGAKEETKQKSTEPKVSKHAAQKRDTERRTTGSRNKSINARVTPGMALANSQRAKVSIVPSEGKRTVFND